eukprot:XP_001610031.1 hypothetical protein [Babesia bovis T2Bo]
MTDNSTHCYGGIWLKSDGNPVRLKAKLAGADDSIVKFEFDRSIPSDVTPKDVLEALGAVEVEGDIADITVRGHRLQCKYVDPKSVILNLGESPERSLDVTDRFLGVVYVSPSLGKTTSASKRGSRSLVTQNSTRHALMVVTNQLFLDTHDRVGTM